MIKSTYDYHFLNSELFCRINVVIIVIWYVRENSEINLIVINQFGKERNVLFLDIDCVVVVARGRNGKRVYDA